MPLEEFHYQEPFPVGADTTDYRFLTKDGVSMVRFEEKDILKSILQP